MVQLNLQLFVRLLFMEHSWVMKRLNSKTCIIFCREIFFGTIVGRFTEPGPKTNKMTDNGTVETKQWIIGMLLTVSTRVSPQVSDF